MDPRLRGDDVSIGIYSLVSLFLSLVSFGIVHPHPQYLNHFVRSAALNIVYFFFDFLAFTEDFFGIVQPHPQ